MVGAYGRPMRRGATGKFSVGVRWVGAAAARGRWARGDWRFLMRRARDGTAAIKKYLFGGRRKYVLRNARSAHIAHSPCRLLQKRPVFEAPRKDIFRSHPCPLRVSVDVLLLSVSVDVL